MKQTLPLPFRMLRVFVLLSISSLPLCLACTGEDSAVPATSGATNWLRCKVNNDCADYSGASCGDDGYCVDDQGNHIVVTSDNEQPGADASSPADSNADTEDSVPADDSTTGGSAQDAASNEQPNSQDNSAPDGTDASTVPMSSVDAGSSETSGSELDASTEAPDAAACLDGGACQGPPNDCNDMSCADAGPLTGDGSTLQCLPERSTGCGGLNVDNPTPCCEGLTCCGGVPYDPTGECWTQCPLVSDRNLKTNISSADPEWVLDQVASLPISTWSYRESESVPHLGPMAQDFHAAFGLGADDTRIAQVDAIGVALAAIQALNRKLDTLAEENAALRVRVNELNRSCTSAPTKASGAE